MLLAHPWIVPLTKPTTITEDAEAEEAAADDSLANAAGALDLDGLSAGDKEVADWVKGSLARIAAGGLPAKEKPALHAAPLDQLSPLNSPLIEKTM